jgi:hypothetical protein
MTADEAGLDKNVKCKCGRSIIVFKGFVYSSKKAKDNG